MSVCCNKVLINFPIGAVMPVVLSVLLKHGTLIVTVTNNFGMFLFHKVMC